MGFEDSLILGANGERGEEGASTRSQLVKHIMRDNIFSARLEEKFM